MEELEQIKKDIEEIKERNKKVEKDKAWETSLFRRVLVATLTYLVVVLFFIFAKLPNPFINAIVPTIGFVLSTLSVSFFKKIWQKT
jgi:preprotein translocase subunit SecF